LTPILTARTYGCQKMHPYVWPVRSGHMYGCIFRHLYIQVSKMPYVWAVRTTGSAYRPLNSAHMPLCATAAPRWGCSGVGGIDSYKSAISAYFVGRSECVASTIASLSLTGTRVKTRALTTIQSTRTSITCSSLVEDTSPALTSRSAVRPASLQFLFL